LAERLRRDRRRAPLDPPLTLQVEKSGFAEPRPRTVRRAEFVILALQCDGPPALGPGQTERRIFPHLPMGGNS